MRTLFNRQLNKSKWERKRFSLKRRTENELETNVHLAWRNVQVEVYLAVTWVTDSSVDFPSHDPGSDSLLPRALRGSLASPCSPVASPSPCRMAPVSPVPRKAKPHVTEYDNKATQKNWLIQGVIVWTSFWFFNTPAGVSLSQPSVLHLLAEHLTFTWPCFSICIRVYYKPAWWEIDSLEQRTSTQQRHAKQIRISFLPRARRRQQENFITTFIASFKLSCPIWRKFSILGKYNKTDSSLKYKYKKETDLMRFHLLIEISWWENIR